MDQWLGVVFALRCKLFINTAIDEDDKQRRKNLIDSIKADLRSSITPKQNPSRSEIYTGCSELTRVYQVNEREKYVIRITGIPDDNNSGKIIPIFFDIFSRSYDDFYLSQFFPNRNTFDFQCPEKTNHKCSVTIKTGGNDFLSMRFPVKSQAMLVVSCRECGYEKDEKTIRTDTISKLGIKTNRSEELRKIIPKRRTI